MPLFFQQQLNAHTQLGVWKIEEPETFFQVPLQRSITHPHKRLQHLAGRYLLPYLAPDFPLPLIKIADTRKPYLEDEAYHFSLSHCGSFAAAIVSKAKRVGIDIEAVSAKVERINHKFISAAESNLLSAWKNDTFINSSLSTANAHLSSPFQLPTLLWSCKEAIFKWYSLGEMDFKEHMQAKKITKTAEGLETDFLFTKNAALLIKLHSRFFGDLCLSYIAT
jgi:phosphopantetheinyl transferase